MLRITFRCNALTELPAAAAAAVAATLTLALSAPASAAPAGPNLDSVILSLDEVNAIARGNGMLKYSSDRGAPSFSGTAPGVPDSCRNVIDETRIYSVDYESFRSVTYSGPSNVAVSQVVAVYPSAEIARKVYDFYVQNLAACIRVYPTQIYGTPVPTVSFVPGNPNSTVLEQVGPGIGRGWARLFQVYGNATIGVTAGNFPPDTPVVWAVTDRIQQNLNAAS